MDKIINESDLTELCKGKVIDAIMNKGLTGRERFPELYGSRAWQALRLEVFIRDAYTCQICGHVTSKPIGDHKIPHEGNRELFFDIDNVWTLCRSCHDSAKRIKERQGLYPGCDVDGNPIDPSHPWFKGR